MKKKPLPFFLAAAKNIRMTPEEKEEMQRKFMFAVRKGGDVRLKPQMENNFFLQSARNIALSGDERTDLKKQLFKAMGRKSWTATSPHSLQALTQSARAIGLTSAEHVGLKEGLFEAMGRTKKSYWNPLRALSTVMASFLIVACAGGGASYAAESAVPGQLLYPVKIHVNEPFLARFAATTEAKAKFNAVQAERRLREAEYLAGTSHLDSATRELLDRYFEQHIAEMNAEVNSLLVAGNAEAAGRIALDVEAEMQAHTHVMEGLATTEETEVLLRPLIENAKRARLDAERVAILAGLDEDVLLKIASDAVTEAIRKAEKSVGVSGKNSSAATEHINKAKESHQQGISAQEQLRRTRSQLRKAKEASILLQVPADSVRKANENEDLQDIEFTTSVRLKLTEESLQDTESKKPAEGSPLDEKIEGTKELLNAAGTAIESGNVTEALEASAEALKQAEAAKGLLP